MFNQAKAGGAAGSPTSPGKDSMKKLPTSIGGGGVSKKQVEELKNMIEDAKKELNEKLIELNTKVSDNMDTLVKKIDDQSFENKRVEQDMADVKKKMENLNQQIAVINQGGGGGGGKISHAQNLLNQEFNESIGKLENEVKRLGRIDFRLNNELV